MHGFGRLEQPSHRKALLENLTEESGIYEEDELEELAKFGVERIVAAGFGLLMISAAVSMSGITLAHFWGGLVLLGLSGLYLVLPYMLAALIRFGVEPARTVGAPPSAR